VTTAIAGELILDEPPSTVRTSPPRILVAGNPNSGKSTLFNALTGARSKVGNYAGVTVAQLSAAISLPGVGAAELVDLPGTYSLSARSDDERVAVDAVLGLSSRRPDVVIVVTDATALGRSLYLATEIIETGTPVVVALSMMDEADTQQMAVDIDALREALGVDVVPVVIPRGEGLAALRASVARVVAAQGPSTKTSLPLPAAVEAAATELSHTVTNAWPRLTEQARRAFALWLLLSLEEDAAASRPDGIPRAVRDHVSRIRRRAADAGRNLDQEIIAARYARIDALVDRAVATRPAPGRSWTEHIDAVLTHRIGGILVFGVVMMGLFQGLFSWSEPAIALIESLVARAQDGVQSVMPAGPLSDLLVNGVIAGVGNVVVFVPQIALLFLFIGVMEDVGYLARVAFVIDRVMARVGLHGKSFVPMLSGFSCAIPAVMATRTLESRTDRLLTMMVLPFMSCSARLPIYLLVIATVFSGYSPLFGVLSVGAVVLFAMYLLSVTVALSAAAVLRRTVLRGPRPTLMLELPPYRVPVVRVLLRNTWQQVRSFLIGAGTVILALTIVLWALLSYPRDPAATQRYALQRAEIESNASTVDREVLLDDLAGRERGEQLRHSLAGRLGRLLEPAIEPLGFDWRIGVGVLGAFAAREVFVSTMGIVFDINDADQRNEPLRSALRGARRGDGSILMTPLTGVSLMVFFVLACQCMSTLAVVRRETDSWRWPAFLFAYQTVVAYTAALIVYQGGRGLGWS
jgi:ferrous iron transport protein B